MENVKVLFFLIDHYLVYVINNYNLQYIKCINI